MNAEVANNIGAKIGESIVYTCLDSFTKVGGDSYLTCSLSPDGAAVWIGEFIACDSKNGKCICKYAVLHLDSVKNTSAQLQF